MKTILIFLTKQVSVNGDYDVFTWPFFIPKNNLGALNTALLPSIKLQHSIIPYN